LHVLKWINGSGTSCNGMMIFCCAAFMGHLDILKWACEQHFGLNNGAICSSAALQGKSGCFMAFIVKILFPASLTVNVSSKKCLDVIRYAHENGCPWNANSSANAALTDDLQVLSYLHENGCPWDQKTCANAAKMGNLKVLKYAHENGCPWDKPTCDMAASHGISFKDNPVLDFDEPEPMVFSQKYLDILTYAHENGCPWDEETCAIAAATHLELLRYAHESGCPWNEKTCCNAAQYGNVKSLKYAHENGCPWDKATCSIAANEGHLDVLQYLYDNDCPWDHDLVPENNDITLESLLTAHKLGSVDVECPSLGTLETDNDESDGVRSTPDVQFAVFICERHVLRCFYNIDVFVPFPTSGRNKRAMNKA
jgi:hypothetical protein